MKKVLLMAIVAAMFSGCFVDKMYDSTKVLYIKGKEVVITNSDLLSDDVLKKLEKLDESMVKLDEKVMDSRDEMPKKQTADGNSTEMMETSLALSVGSDLNISEVSDARVSR